jgi:hypothetical protein
MAVKHKDETAPNQSYQYDAATKRLKLRLREALAQAQGNKYLWLDAGQQLGKHASTAARPDPRRRARILLVSLVALPIATARLCLTSTRKTWRASVPAPTAAA